MHIICDKVDTCDDMLCTVLASIMYVRTLLFAMTVCTGKFHHDLLL